MPFDSANFDDLSVFTPGLMGLKKLSQLLRKEMPKRFAWHFCQYKIDLDELKKRKDSDVSTYERYFSFLHMKMESSGCNTAGCAIGLAATVWPEIGDILVNKGIAMPNWMADEDKVINYFGITKIEAHSIFLSSIGYGIAEVTPHMVADKIDKLLKDKYGIV